MAITLFKSVLCVSKILNKSQPTFSSQIAKKQQLELSNFIKDSMSKITDISNKYIQAYIHEKRTRLERHHSIILEKMQTYQVKKTVDQVKQIKRNKTVSTAEQSRQIKEIRQTNAKNIREKKNELEGRRDFDMKKMNEIDDKMESKFVSDLKLEIDALTFEWSKVPFGLEGLGQHVTDLENNLGDIGVKSMSGSSQLGRV